MKFSKLIIFTENYIDFESILQNKLKTHQGISGILKWYYNFFPKLESFTYMVLILMVI